MLDPGSQVHLVALLLVKKLKIESTKIDKNVCGVGESEANISKGVDLKIQSFYSDYEVKISCLVLPTITQQLPQCRINTEGIKIPKNIRLADPAFNKPGPIDILIGAALYWKLLEGAALNKIEGQPALQNTKFGWIIGGELNHSDETSNTAACLHVTNEMLNDQLERFWHQEELPRLRNHTEEEQLCERHFIENVKRDETGRFIVRLPTKSTVELGKSKDQALKRFYALERRLERDENLKRLYCEFMNNYLDRGHMSRVQENEDLESAYFIPHQYVWRPDSITTKLRVVFDASARTTSGKSLNDKLMTGPNLQSELIDIILRFRSYNFVLTADIEGMFRQITDR